ncbi:MAG: MFS transporter [Longimicrobiales bacterium]
MTVVLAVAHAVNDGYAAFLAPLLPRIMTRLDISIAAAAGLSMALSIASSLPQPAVGWASDRFGRRAFVAFGPLLSGVVLSLMGFAPSFWALLLLLVVGGLGSAMFHPPGVSLATRAGEGTGSGLRLSIFSFGGTIGYALGPLVAVALVTARGLEGLWIAMVPAFLVFVVVWRLGGAGPDGKARPRPPGPREVLGHLKGPLGSVFWISAIGAFVQRTYLTLQPIAIAGVGGSEALGALSLSIYLGAQAAGTLTGGWLTDRMSRTRLLAVLTGAGAPVHLLAVGLAPGSAEAMVAGALAGFLNMALLPPLVVTAQEILPEAASSAAGIAMGLAWATGSLGVLMVGALADATGPQFAQLAAMPTLFIGTALALGPALRSTGAGTHRNA